MWVFIKNNYLDLWFYKVKLSVKGIYIVEERHTLCYYTPNMLWTNTPFNTNLSKWTASRLFLVFLLSNVYRFAKTIVHPKITALDKCCVGLYTRHDMFYVQTIVERKTGCWQDVNKSIKLSQMRTYRFVNIENWIFKLHTFKYEITQQKLCSW